LNFLDRFSINLIKICLLGAKFHAAGRTDRQGELIVPFCNFANAPKKESISFSVTKHGRNRITKRERR
jgi:hypothetical protein